MYYAYVVCFCYVLLFKINKFKKYAFYHTIIEGFIDTKML